jgi:acetyl-CoA synthetase
MGLANDESELIWFPSYDKVASANITSLLNEYGFTDYAQLDELLANDDQAFQDFYEKIIGRLDLTWQRPWEKLLDTERGIAFAEWFQGAQFNAAENCLDRWIKRGRGSQQALIWEDEHGSTRSLTYSELRDQTARCASALQKIGIKPGMTVGIWMPMVPESAIALLAIGYIGAVAVPAFSGYGAIALATRLNDAGATVLIAADTLSRRGKRTSTLSILREVAENTPALQHIVLWTRFDAPPPSEASAPVSETNTALLANDLPPLRRRPGKVFKNIPGETNKADTVQFTPEVNRVDEFALQFEEATVEAFGRSLPSVTLHGWDAMCLAEAEAAIYLKPVVTDANAPYLLLYTSGSTGKPKGAVHPHAGFPIKVAIDQYLCFDMQPGDRMLWYTDMGWMMGPFLVLGALILGGTVVLYDGTPDYPTPDRLWAVAARHRVTHLGVAPTAVRSLATHGEEWPAKHNLSALRILGSSGEPWNTAPYKWFLQNIGGGRAPIINYSGGTEIGGGILGCFPTMPLGPNAFHGRIPGMRADVVDDAGASKRGEVGELVMRGPWPGMTQSLWGGSAGVYDDERFLSTYWERIPGMWTHGDWAQIDELVGPDGHTPQQLWYIRGRSDDTIKVAGKRVGPTEFESVLAGHPAVREAAAIGVPDELKGDAVVILVVLKQREAEEAREARNAKVMRRVARGRYLGMTELGDLSGLENLSALEAIDAAR